MTTPCLKGTCCADAVVWQTLTDEPHEVKPRARKVR